MNRQRATRLFVAWLWGALAAVGAAPATAQLIDNVQVTEFVFSPNGDGAEEATLITVTMTDSASVDAIVYRADSVTVTDTLFAAIVLRPESPPQTVAWTGKRFDGTPAPEDSFVVAVTAVAGTTRETVYRIVKIDNTPPQVAVANLFPFLFGPGSPDAQSSELTVEFDVFDPHPSDRIRAIVDIVTPDGVVFETVLDDLVTVNQRHTVVWAPELVSSDPDGIYEVRVQVEDQGSNTGGTFATVNVDNAPPVIQSTNLSAGSDVNAIPDSLFGYAFDRNGRGDRMGAVDSLFVRFRSPPQGQPLAYFEPVQHTVVVRDTLFFSIALVDSITGDGEYNLGLRAVDILGREQILPFGITLDSAAPPAPRLIAPASPVTRLPVFALDADVSADTDEMNVFRNGVFFGSVQPNIPGLPMLPFDVDLLPGENRLTATAVDAAGNESSTSNEIVVTFDSAAGLGVPQPFRPGDGFQLNLANGASSIDVFIYDLAGDLVRTLRSTSGAPAVTIPWNGLNGDNESVKKGPLVVVVRVTYPDGNVQRFREIFLFGPEG